MVPDLPTELARGGQVVKRSGAVAVLVVLLAGVLTGCLSLDTKALPTIPVGLPSQIALHASGGTTPLAWSASGLPDGLALDATTGIITGVPSATGTFDVAVTVRDAEGRTQTQHHALGVSTSSSETLADAGRQPAISGDGRYVAFVSRSADLPGAQTDVEFVYVTDRQTATTVQVPDSAGASEPAIAADGSSVAFHRFPEVRVWDRGSSQSVLVTSAADRAWGPSLSADGTLLAYATGTGPVLQVRLLDRTTGTTTVVSSGSAVSGAPTVSADGSTVVFHSQAEDLVPGDHNQQVDIFAWDRATGVLTLLDRHSNAFALDPTVSANGRFVVFSQASLELVPGYGDEYQPVARILLWDRSTDELTNVRPPIRLASGAHQVDSVATISDDARSVAYVSRVRDFLPGAPSEVLALFVWDRSTDSTTRVADGEEIGDPVLSGDGGTIAYDADAIELWERTAP